MIRSEAGGLKTAPSLMAMVHEGDFSGDLNVKKEATERSMNCPHHPAHPCCLICVGLLHPPPCCFTLPLPSWDCTSSASAVSNLLAGTTLSCFLFPFLSDRVPAPHEEVSYGFPFVLKHLAVRNPTVMQFHYLHAKSINERISKVK